MFKKKSIAGTYFISSFVVLLLLFSSLAYFWIYQEQKQFKTESEKLRGEFIGSQKRFIRNEVEKAVDYIGYKKSQTEARVRKEIQSRVYEAHALATHVHHLFKGEKSTEELEHLVREALRPIRFNKGRGYYFATSLEGTEKLFADKPELEGKDLIHMQDTKGKFVIKDMIRIAKQSKEGFYEYTWTKPKTKGRDFPKIAFVKHFEPFDWFIGTGEYLDDMEKEIQQEVVERISKIRFGNDGYVFVCDFNGTCVSHINEKLIGKAMIGLTDPNGVKIIRELIKAAMNSEGGYVDYVWEKPSLGRDVLKMGYARAFEDWGWVIGTGVYLDDVEKAIAEQLELYRERVRRQIAFIVFLFAASIVITVLILRYFSNRIQRGIEAFASFFKNSAVSYEKIDATNLPFSEFETLAHFSNKMVDDRERAQEEKKRLQAQLQRAEKMEAMGTLAGGIAHDLNNILGGLVSYPDLLLMELPKDSPLREPISIIQKSGKRAAAIVQDLLTLARRGVAVKEVANLNDIVAEYLKSPELEKLKTYHPGVQIQTRLETDLFNIECSSIHLSKMIMNLVSNAAEAVIDGGTITISTRNEYVDRPIKGYDHVKPGDYVVLTVKDDGQGILPENLEKIFEPFYTKKRMGRSGTGLGMAVVWGTVKDHHGYIDVESKEGQGTIFSIYLPVTKKELSATERIGSIDAYLGNGETVLVVDDVEEQRKIASMLLSRLGYRVDVVSSGEEAIAFMQTHSADLLILDMIMAPGIDGLDTYKRILEFHPEQKAVIASGFSETERVKAAQKLGAGRYIKKPYTLEKIGLAVKGELNR